MEESPSGVQLCLPRFSFFGFPFLFYYPHLYMMLPFDRQICFSPSLPSSAHIVLYFSL